MKKEDYTEEQIKAAWNSPVSPVPEEEVERSWKEMTLKLKLQPKKSHRSTIKIFISVAATFLLLIGGNFYLERINPTITTENSSLREKQVRLSDGSLVILKSGAQLTYKQYFTEERKVNLRGEAFFKVAKDSLREFTVTIGSSTIKVLGTSFLVKGMGDNDTQVALFTGRVTVSIKGIAESWGLIPGERLVYNNGEARLEMFDVQLSFEGGDDHIDIESMKMEEFIPFIQDRFGYRFSPGSYNPDKRITLRINKTDSLNQILKVLSIINNKSYEIKEETKEIVPSKK